MKILNLTKMIVIIMIIGMKIIIIIIKLCTRNM